MWNINGCSEVIRALWDTCDYLAQFPIIALTETQRPDFAPSLLQGYEHLAVHAPVGGRRGHGLALYVRENISSGVSVWRHDAEQSVLWVRFPGMTFGVDRSVFLGVVYMPPQGSHRLQLQSQEQRYAELAAQAGRAQELGHVILCGDFNAHVSGDGGRGLNAAGCSLLSFCDACNLTLLTGVLPGDCPAAPSFAARAHTSPSRPDHVIVSGGLLPQVNSLYVHGDRADSDHFPLCVCLSVCEVSRSGGAIGTVGSCRRLKWDRRGIEAYQEGLLDSSCMTGFQSVQHCLDSSDVTGATAHLRRVLLGSAEAAGMKAKNVCISGTKRVFSRQKPWFDDQCRQLKAAVKAERAAGASVASARLRQARAAFKKAARRKRRQYRRQRVTDLLAQSRDPQQCKQFWDALTLPAGRLPQQLQSPLAWTDTMRDALNPAGNSDSIEPGIMEGSPPPADGSVLSNPITREEVVAALCALKNYKSCGASGCPTELFKYALLPDDDPSSPLPEHADVANHLTRLLNVVFHAGEVPGDWNEVLVSPVFKHGDKANMTNYRPISVGDSLEKLYAIVLNARLVGWLEANGLRASCQAGFRPHLGTEHQLFALRHCVEECRRRHQPLYACFLDFAKAYDSVPRHLLWHILHSIGVPARFLSAVQSMYANVTCRVNIGGALGPCFEACKGVKQGCPLSPTLFGIFIDRFYFMLMHRTQGNVGPALRSGRRVPSLFYADDGLLLTTKSDDMHQCCACLDVFCRRSDMQLNLKPGKTEMMLFAVSNDRRAALQQQHSFTLAGQTVRWVAQYQYLGCQVHERWLYGTDFPSRASRMLVKSLHLRRELDHLDAARSVRLGLRLYDVKVRPSATYASCVWATRFNMVGHTSAVVRNDLEKRQLAFIRGWCHLRGSEPTWLVYRELGRLPLHYYWWRDIVRFANRVLQLPDGSIWKEMLQDSFQSHAEGKRCWASDVCKFLQNVGIAFQYDGTSVIDESDVMAALLRAYDTVWDGLCRHPRQAPDRTKLATYFAWFDRGAWLRRPQYLYFDYPAPATCTYLRFRLGSHNLQVELGRWQDRRPRCHRICQRCALQSIDDEWHMVYECPVFDGLRAARRFLFSGTAAHDLSAFMRQRDQKGVFQHILACLREVHEHLNVDHSQDVDVGIDEQPDTYDSD